jgi:hypothetical protein
MIPVKMGHDQGIFTDSFLHELHAQTSHPGTAIDNQTASRLISDLDTRRIPPVTFKILPGNRDGPPGPPTPNQHAPLVCLRSVLPIQSILPPSMTWTPTCFFHWYPVHFFPFRVSPKNIRPNRDRHVPVTQARLNVRLVRVSEPRRKAQKSHSTTPSPHFSPILRKVNAWRACEP